MIDISKAKNELNACENYTISWFNNLGFDIRVESQNTRGTKLVVTRGGVSDTFELTATRMYKYATDLEIYLQLWYDSYLRKVENMRLREELEKRGIK